ncbi:MAG: AraC family transcriptional regulator [Pseudomonadales bacterium]|nr:AraC family transcriptional regulator [Pseudomonadales bacterium]
MTVISPIDALPKQQIAEPTAMHSWAVVIAQTLENSGCDSQQIFAKANVEYKLAVNPYMRVPTSKMNRLFELSVAATNNPAFGLSMVEFIHPTTFHALGYSLFASSTLQDYFDRLARFFRIASDNCRHHIDEQSDAVKLRIELLVPNLSLETQDGWSATLVKFTRQIYKPSFNPLKITLPRPDLGDAYRRRFEDYFRCPIEFNATEWAIYFDKNEVIKTLPGANSELALINDQVVMEYLAKIEKSDVINLVRTHVIKSLPAGNCSKEYIAGKLNFSARSLQNKLDILGTSYQDILDQTRKDLALKYMQNQYTTNSEITYLLGFSDTSNFSRAFKRWFGCTPSQYRNQAGYQNI